MKPSVLKSIDLEKIHYFYRKLHIKIDREDSHLGYALMDNPLKDDIPFNDSVGNYDMIISKNNLQIFEKKSLCSIIPHGDFLVFKRLAHKYPANAKFISKTAVLH